MVYYVVDIKFMPGLHLRKSDCVPTMGLLINEEVIVQKILEQLEPLLNAVILCILTCTITYLLRQCMKERRERRLHREQMKQLQRAGGCKNIAD